MVSQKSVEKQLKRIGFKLHGWGRGELSELPHILLEGEEIYECVNGIYEGGFALLLATDVRVLLVDKKPLNFLTVEDLRFDMINEMDYNHRLIGAEINISSGSKILKFRSYNQPRLRKLIGHVQHCMADAKKKQSSHQEGQVQHLEKLNEQLQQYLVAQQQYQLQLQQQQAQGNTGQVAQPILQAPKPSPELSDYLFAQSLLAQHQEETGRTDLPPVQPQIARHIQTPVAATDQQEIYAAGVQEIFGKHPDQLRKPPTTQQHHHHPLEINAMRVAYSKLPLAMRNRKFGRPSFHAHSENNVQLPAPQPAEG